MFRELYKGKRPPRFRPYCDFDPELDLIEMLSRDCSFTDHLINRCLSILTDNHPEPRQNVLVGFRIWGFKSYCFARGISVVKEIDLACVLQEIDFVFPDPKTRNAVQKAIPGLLWRSGIRSVDLL